MTKKQFSRLIILWELAGFGIVILFLWLNELLDIPHHLFGGIATPINVTESIYETIIVLCLSISVVLITLRLLRKIRYLEGFLPVCSYCKRIRADNEWIPIEKYIRDHSEAEFSHGLCPECIAKHYGDVLSNNK